MSDEEENDLLILFIVEFFHKKLGNLEDNYENKNKLIDNLQIEYNNIKNSFESLKNLSNKILKNKKENKFINIYKNKKIFLRRNKSFIAKNNKLIIESNYKNNHSIENIKINKNKLKKITLNNLKEKKLKKEINNKEYNNLKKNLKTINIKDIKNNLENSIIIENKNINNKNINLNKSVLSINKQKKINELLNNENDLDKLINKDKNITKKIKMNKNNNNINNQNDNNNYSINTNTINNKTISFNNNNSLEELINSYTDTTKSSYQIINKKKLPISVKNFKTNYINQQYIKNIPINIQSKLEFKNQYDFLHRKPIVMRLTNLESILRNYDNIFKFLDLDEQYYISMINKSLLHKFLLNIKKEYEGDKEYNNNLIKSLEEKYNNINSFNDDSNNFIFEENILQCFDLLNKGNYCDFFKIIRPPPKDDILIVYKIFIQFLNTKLPFINRLNNDNKLFWKKLCDYLIWNSHGGDYLGKLIKDLCYQMNFNIKNILLIKNLSKDYINIITPLYYNKKCVTTTIFSYIVKRIMEYSGVIENEKSSPYYLKNLYEFRINNANKKIKKLNVLITKLNLNYNNN